MKNIQQTLITISSLIIITFFISPVQAEVCVGDYTIDLTNSSGDIAALSGCTEITGNLIIDDSTLVNLTGLENLTSVGGNLEIIWNNLLTSLTGLDNLTSVGGNLTISVIHFLTSLSALSNLTGVGGDLYIYDSPLLTSLSGIG